MRTFILITLLFLDILGGGIYLAAFYKPTEAATSTPTETTIVKTTATQPITETTQTTSVSASSKTTTETAPVATTKTPSPAKTSTCVKGGACTQTEVAEHNTRTDCYVSMSNTKKVYDVTAYVTNNSSMHPGGDIADYCGQDIYTTFVGADGSHRHSGRAMQDLTSFAFANLR